MNINSEQMEKQIKQKQNLDMIGATLEKVLNRNLEPGNRAGYLYLYGLTLFQKSHREQALKVLEEAVKLDDALAPAYFVLARIMADGGHTIKALEYYERCVNLDYRKHYCMRTQVKLAYKAGDFAVTLNLLSAYRLEYKRRRMGEIVRIACLKHLKLMDEAENAYQHLLQQGPIRPMFRQWLDGLLAHKEESEYAICYESNQRFFREQGKVFPEYGKVKYKVGRFLNHQLVYGTETEQIMLALRETRPEDCNLRIEYDDVVMIHNTDNIQVFRHLEEVLNELDSPVYRKRMGAIPVFVIESNLSSWEVMMQIFSFEKLRDWKNLHYFIGMQPEELREVFMNDKAVLPSLFYGDGLDELQNFLLEIKAERDAACLKRLHKLQDTYRLRQVGSFQKILVISSIYQEMLHFYGQILQQYLQKSGYDCRLYTEPEPYFKYSHEADLQMIEEYQPDLVIHLYTVRDELEIFKSLDLPFVSWLFFTKELGPAGTDQPLLITGNAIKPEELTGKKYHGYDYTVLPLGQTSQEAEKNLEEQEHNDIGVIADLENQDRVFKRIVESVFYKLVTQQRLTMEEMTEVFKAVYFDVYTEHINRNFIRPEVAKYQKILQTHFSARNLNFDDLSLEVIAALFKKEMENSLFKLLQVRWVLGGMAGYDLELYGEGWDKDPDLQPYHERNVDFLHDMATFQRIVRRNKVNLYIGNRLNNQSYMQPDLLHGLALGGFFLVHDLHVKDHGPKVLEPFGGLLETYGSREEMLDKLKYFLEHDAEREERASALQQHVRENFTIERVAKAILTKSREMLRNNLQ